MCSPCGPMVCYKYEDCGPPKGKTSDSARKSEEGGAKKDEKENQLKRTKSRELRGGIMYYSCHCIKRNGLQHDCRRTGCGGEPACLVLPDPVCAPSQLARARGLADPAPFAAHLRAQAGGSESVLESSSGTGSGKRFIVCELKGLMPDHEQTRDKSGKCCKCPNISSPVASSGANSFPCLANPSSTKNEDSKCVCKSPDLRAPFTFDEETLNKILNRFENKEVIKDEINIGPGGRVRKTQKAAPKVEPCTRPGCVHWKPPPPCVWDAPCKADCFETPPGIRPGKNPWVIGGNSKVPGSRPSGQTGQKIILLSAIE